MPNDVPIEPRWIDLESLRRINERVVASTAEPFGLRDVGLLESAWGRPQNLWAYRGEEDVVVLAVALMAGVAQNHPFLQGNKRTAFEAGVLLLELNGWRFDGAPDGRDLADAFVALIEHRTNEADFAALLRPHVHPRA